MRQSGDLTASGGGPGENIFTRGERFLLSGFLLKVDRGDEISARGQWGGEEGDETPRVGHPCQERCQNQACKERPTSKSKSPGLRGKRIQRRLNEVW